MLKGPIEGSVALLETLHDAGVPLYGITNFAADTFAETRKAHPFFDRLKGIIVSGEEKLLKPDAAIFELLLSRYGLRAEDCVFIDDVEKNVKGAQAIGMHALLFTSPERLERAAN
jgi:2-haloacid dehalogenase